MELDILEEDKVMEDIKVISYDNKDKRDDSEHSDIFWHPFKWNEKIFQFRREGVTQFYQYNNLKTIASPILNLLFYSEHW